jgi:CRP-like cAMP-binding protein
MMKPPMRRGEAIKRPSRAGGEPVKTRRRKTAAPKRRTAPIVVRRRSSSPAAQEAEIAQLTSLRDEALAQLRKTEISLHSAQSLLSKLPDHLAADLFAAGTSVRLAADQVLFQAGDAGDGCYRVEDGLLKITMVSSSGDERILAFLGPSGIVGELSMIDGRPRSASVVAVRKTTLSFLSRAAFQEFAGKHPDIYMNLVTLLVTRLRETDVVLATGSFLPVQGRVARALLELAEVFGKDVGSGRVVIRQKIGHRDLGAMAGIARETVSRMLNDLKRRNVISWHSGYYFLENKAKLEQEAEL